MNGLKNHIVTLKQKIQVKLLKQIGIAGVKLQKMVIVNIMVIQKLTMNVDLIVLCLI